MESTTLSPNGVTGIAPTHSLASPAAERMLDTILATPFAEADPPAEMPPPELPAELPPAADIEPEPPPAGDPFTMLPTPATNEPGADPAVDPSAEPPAEEPPSLPEGMAVFLPENVTATEPEAPAAQPEPEPEPPAQEEHQEATQETTEADQLRATITMQYQPTEFAIFRGKPVEITAHHNEDAFFSGHYVTIDKTTGKIIAGGKIEMQPAAQLEPLRNATSLLRLRKGLMLRAAEVLDAMITALGQEIEKVDACMTALAATKTAIRDLLPEKSKDLIF